LSLEPDSRVYLAGPICLELEGTVVREARFPGRQGRLAFAVLVLGRSDPMTRDALADAIWDGELPGAWETALRAVVSKLRTLLVRTGFGPNPIASASGCYQLLLPREVWVDVEAADDAAHRGEAALLGGERAEAVGWALVAASISARPFLPGDRGAFAEAWRERLRTIRVRALEVRGAALLQSGQFPLAARDAETVLALSPFRETALQVLMRAHAGAGNPAEALRVYERARRMLAEELGADPSVETQALHAEILSST
jgi:DNA-binding SARP family transcriptional activator